MAWLAEHQTLTTSHIAAALLPSRRAAQKRLYLLHQIRAVDRFTFAATPTARAEWRYILGPLRDLLHPGPGGRRSQLQRRADIARSPVLAHRLGVNGFFTTLHGYARTHPAAVLHRW